MMEQRELNKEEEEKYFSSSEKVPQVEVDEGTREIGKQLPFIISGGSNTEYYYFKHINDLTQFKFHIKPEYFGDESAYISLFPKRIEEIKRKNDDAKVFCVYDMDTVFLNSVNKEKHKDFEKKVKDDSNIVELCPSMPCIEYWFLLHFINYTNKLENYSKVSQLLAPYIKPCFPQPSVKLKKLLKSKEYVEDPQWVRELSADGKLETAIKRAEENIANAKNDIENLSYSYVYKIFKFATENI